MTDLQISINFYGPVGDVVTAFFVSSEIELQRAAIERAGCRCAGITLAFKSSGGDTAEGERIVDALAATGLPVTALIEGAADSCASWAAVMADRVYARPAATMRVHRAQAAHDGPLTPEEQRTIDLWSDTTAAIYFAKSGRPVSFWADLMAQDTRLDADELLELGLIDAVLATGAPVPEAPDTTSHTRHAPPRI